MADMVKNSFSQTGFLKRNVLIQKDENGFGLTVSGDNPVYVQTVKPGSAADKAGVECGDKIIKVNGTLVTESNHIEVVSLIKSGSYVALTLLGKDNKQQVPHVRGAGKSEVQPSAIPQPTSPYSPTSPSSPHGNTSDRIKDVKRNLDQEREYNKSILDKYTRAPSPTTHDKLVESKTRIAALEKNLFALSGSSSFKTSTSYRSPVQPVDRPSSHNSTDFLPRSTSSYHSLSNFAQFENTSQHSSLGSSSTPNLGMMNSNKMSKMDSDYHEGHSSIETVTEEPATDNSMGMDWLKTHFEAAGNPQMMMNTFGCVQTNSIDDIYSAEDDEFLDEGEQLDKHGPFERLDLLNFKDKCAHLAVFLHYLISNNDPTPLFFWVVTDIYASNEARNDNVKEWKKWAYEIYSTFVAPSAPLKVNIGSELEEKRIEDAIKEVNVTENRLRNIFDIARNRLKPELEERLGEFRQKRSIGLGGMFGDRQLEDDMDRLSELRIVETTLMPHLDALLGEQQMSPDTFTSTDKNSAQACAIATLMKAVGLNGKVSSGKGTALEYCRRFGEKEKSSFINNISINKLAKKPIKDVTVLGHKLQGVQYYSTTYCTVCKGLLWGIGIQGYDCQFCDFHVHPKDCMTKINDDMGCTGGNKPRGSKPSKPRHWTLREPLPPGIPPGGGTYESEPNVRGHSHPVTLPEDSRPNSDDNAHGNPPDNASDRGTPTPQDDPSTTPVIKKASAKRVKEEKTKKPTRPTTSPGPYQTREHTTSPQPESEEEEVFSDSDLNPLDTLDQVPWVDMVDKKLIKKLRTKEIKRQEVIHELLHTEKTHVRNLKILDKLFYRNIMNKNALDDDEIKKIFPNLEELLEIHQSLLRKLEKKASESPVIDDIGDIMLEAFGGDARDIVKEKFATFCEKQKIHLREWRTYRETRKDFALLMSKLEAHSLCRRLGFDAILASTHQRLSKYPLLLENLNKTQKDVDADYEKVAEATDCCKHILNYVNDSIKQCEDDLRLKELSTLIEDRRMKASEDESGTEEKTEKEVPVGQFDILQHKLVMEGDLVWKIKNEKKLDLHVVLLNDTLLLLTKQDDKFQLKTQNLNENKGQSPLIPISKTIIRQVATDKKAFFLVSTSQRQPHIYELIAPTHLEQKNWVEAINKAIDLNLPADSPNNRRPPFIPNSASATTSPTPPTPTTPVELEPEEQGDDEKDAGHLEISDFRTISSKDQKNGKDESGLSDESDDEYARPTPTYVLSKERKDELDRQLAENDTQLKNLIRKRADILSEMEGDKYFPFKMEPSYGREKFVISAIEQVDQLRDTFGQLSSNLSEDQRDCISQSITGVQRNLKIILDDTITNRHNSIASSVDGDKDLDRISKRSSSKVYSSDLTDSLSRYSPLSDQKGSPPPILVSRSSQEIENNGVEEAVQDFEDLSSAIRGIVEDAAPLQSTDAGSLNDGSSSTLESGNLIASPFKIQKLRNKLGRPNEPSSQD